MNEEDLLVTVITHPAGYMVDLFGGLLSVRGTEDPRVWEVEWQRRPDAQPEDPTHRAFDNSRDAVRFFLEKRREWMLGIDLEVEAMARRSVVIKLEDVPADPPMIREQIEVRRTLINQCVGWLYPGILRDEIDALKEKLIGLGEPL